MGTHLEQGAVIVGGECRALRVGEREPRRGLGFNRAEQLVGAFGFPPADRPPGSVRYRSTSSGSRSIVNRNLLTRYLLAGHRPVLRLGDAVCGR